MFQWVSRTHVRHQCSGHSAQVFPLQRSKDARSAGIAVHTVSLCCCGDAATSRARQVLAQHAPSCCCLKRHLSLTLEVDPLGQAGKWALLLVCDPSAQFCSLLPRGVPNTVLIFSIRLSFQHLLGCDNASYSSWKSCISLGAKLISLFGIIQSFLPFLMLWTSSGQIMEIMVATRSAWVRLKSSSWEASTRSISTCVVLWAQSQCYYCCTWLHKCNNIEYSAAFHAGGVQSRQTRAQTRTMDLTSGQVFLRETRHFLHLQVIKMLIILFGFWPHVL